MALFTGHTITPDSALGGIQIEKSLRFEESDTTYLEASPTFNTKKYTFSFWFKPVKKGGGVVLGYNMVGNNRQTFSYDDWEGHWANQLRKGGSTKSQYASTAPFRDFSAWYHVVFVWDTDNGTQDDRFIVYVNGVRVAMTQYTGTVSGETGYIGGGNTLNIGKSTDGYSKGRFYLADYYLIDGQAYDPTYFGYTDAQTGQWRPKKYTGSYGSGGFHLEFKDTSNLGKDTSGNANNWTAHNFSVSAGYGNDSLEDTPTNNFCVMNQADESDATITNGGLEMTQASDPCRARGTHVMSPNTGKYYYEMEVQTGSSYIFGMKSTLRLGSGTSGNEGRYGYYGHNGYKNDPSSSTSYGATYGGGDKVAILYDSDSGEVYFYKNGTSQGLAFTGVNTTDYQPFVYLDNYGTAPIVHFNFGQRPFAYTPPTGARGLSSKTFPAPVPAGVVNPQRHFDSILYTGNGSTQSPSGLEFTPDFVWIKARSVGHSNAWFDSVRGVSKVMYSNGRNEEGSYSGLLTSFHRGGFTVGNYDDENQNSTTYVAWCWKAGGAAVTNNDGNITSSVSANQEAGFSVATYTGSTASGALTVGHGLGRKPAWVIIKRRDGGNHDWIIGHQGLATNAFANNKFVKFDNAAVYTNSQVFGAEPTTTVTQIVTDGSSGATNLTSSGTYVMYSWAEIPGYSKFGSYIGNGSSDGTYVHLGFRPAWILIDNYGASGFNWVLQDNKRSPFNLCDNKLNPDSSAAEQTNADKLDMLANGFKCRVADAGINANNSNYIYMAFAERPSGTMFGLDANAR